jgi:succinate dehydrogenase/fumarate reductase flavoprotein subunit
MLYLINVFLRIYCLLCGCEHLQSSYTMDMYDTVVVGTRGAWLQGLIGLSDHDLNNSCITKVFKFVRSNTIAAQV